MKEGEVAKMINLAFVKETEKAIKVGPTRGTFNIF